MLRYSTTPEKTGGAHSNRASKGGVSTTASHHLCAFTVCCKHPRHLYTATKGRHGTLQTGWGGVGGGGGPPTSSHPPADKQESVTTLPFRIYISFSPRGAPAPAPLRWHRCRTGPPRDRRAGLGRGSAGWGAPLPLLLRASSPPSLQGCWGGAANGRCAGRWGATEAWWLWEGGGRVPRGG